MRNPNHTSLVKVVITKLCHGQLDYQLEVLAGARDADALAVRLWEGLSETDGAASSSYVTLSHHGFMIVVRIRSTSFCRSSAGVRRETVLLDRVSADEQILDVTRVQQSQTL
jgi:hypothetical protein